MPNNSAVKMLLSILAILSVLQQGYPLETSEEKKSTCSYVCNDDGTLKIMRENIDYLVNGFKTVLLKLDAMNTNTNQQDITTELPSNLALEQSELQSGVLEISIPNSEMEPIAPIVIEDPIQKEVLWTIIQRRMDGTVDFYRNWTEYQQGFGNSEGEFFLGLDKIHALTNSAPHELWIKMEDFENNTLSANYSNFAIGDASDSYILKNLGKYSGDAGDSLWIHKGAKFSTHDRDNDFADNVNCAIQNAGAWWYKDCYHSNLNGRYLNGVYGSDIHGQGIVWYTWHDFLYSLKYVHMAIRPVSTSE